MPTPCDNCNVEIYNDVDIFRRSFYVTKDDRKLWIDGKFCSTQCLQEYAKKIRLEEIEI